MTFGTALHETLQHYITTIYEVSGAAADRIDLEEYFEDRFRETYLKDYKSNKNLHFSTPEEMNEFFTDGIEIINFLKKKRGKYFGKKGWYLVGCELPLIVQPNPQYNNILYKGYLDVVLYHEATNKFRLNYAAINQMIEYHTDYHFKPVWDGTPENLQEIETARVFLNIPKRKTYIMPAGDTREELREIVFKEITTTDFSHTTQLSTLGDIDSTQAVGWFAMKIQTDLRLVGGYDVIYGKLKDFIRSYLFDKTVDLEDRNTMRNLSESQATMVTLDGFKKAINELTLQDSGSAVVVDSIKLRNTKSFPVNDQEYVVPRKSIFNRIVGDSHLELRFANYLDECEDVVTFAKLYQQIGMKIDYIDSEGKIRDYYPDFIVKLKDNKVYIVETKGAVDVDVPRKIQRLKLWCEDVNKQNKDTDVVFDFVYVQDKAFDELLKTYTDGLLKGKGKQFSYMVELFREYKD